MTRTLQSDNGASATLRGPVFEVREPGGRTVFEYDTRSGRAFFHLSGATLDLRSVDGKIEIGSEQGLRLRSAESIELLGGDSRLELRDGMTVAAPRLDARVGETKFQGRVIHASAEEVRTAWGKLELTVGRLLQWTRNLYLRVEELVHTRAGRIRTESTGAHEIQAEYAHIRAQEEVKIQGEQIHLG